jgi:actin related protein 2/3 complex subunit 2
LYHVSTPKSKTLLQISISLNYCYKELVKYGVKDLLSREYGKYLLPESESGYDVSLEINLESLPSNEGNIF